MTCLTVPSMSSACRSFTPEPADRIWADDRYINGYLRRDAVPIVSIVDVLKALVSAKELTASEYYRLVNRLRAAKCSFIPIEAGEILNHLVQAPVTSYTLSETPEMGVLRRSWAENLLRSNHLQRPGAFAANAAAEIAFLLASVNAVRHALAGLWATNPKQTDEESRPSRQQHAGLECHLPRLRRFTGRGWSTRADGIGDSEHRSRAARG